MTIAPPAPTAPPLRTVAPTAPMPAGGVAAPVTAAPSVAAAPAPMAAAPTTPPAAAGSGVDLIDAIAASDDPAAELTRIVLAVSGRTTSAAAQGRVLHAVKTSCEQMLKSVRAALLSSVVDAAHPNGRPGAYPGFTVTAKSGSRSLSYSDLKELHPDVYDELVTVGDPTLSVTYTA